MTLFTRFLKNESGATAIEYALIAAIVGIGLIGVTTALVGDGTDGISGAFSRITTELDNQVVTP